MREMKDSGVEWIGEIPRDWRILRNKNLFFEINERCLSGDDFQLLSVSEYYGVAPRIERIEDGDMITHAESLEGYKICKQGDIVMNIMLAWKRATGVSNFEGIISPAYCVYRAKKNVNPYYYHYLFRTDVCANLFKQYSTGVIDSRLRLYSDKFFSLPMIVPSVKEQLKISSYLDTKCSQIDAIITREQVVIEKLKEYKLLVITELVTKGLNPDVPMKDSNYEFIGIIPEHWKVAKFGSIFSFLGGYAYNSDVYVSESLNQVLRIGNVKNDHLILKASPVYISEDTAQQTDRFKLTPGNILFTMTGTKGKRDYFFTHLLKNDDFTDFCLYLNQRVGCLIPSENVCAGYYNYLLKDSRILDSVFLYETGTANQGNLGIDSIRRTKLQVPPYKEQCDIYEYIHQRCEKVDSFISHKQSLITKLTEYKKSLIYEVVTGKKEV